MVTAILDGTKTQTRRIWKPRPGKFDDQPHLERCPYGQPGDQLWVRETFALTGDNASPIVHPVHGGVAWRATDHSKAFTWKPSIHMPRWASRITLEITGIRVERLQSITEQDAIAEGIALVHGKEMLGWNDYEAEILGGLAKAKDSYASLWRSINGPESWNQNPYVWVVEFKRITT